MDPLGPSKPMKHIKKILVNKIVPKKTKPTQSIPQGNLPKSPIPSHKFVESKLPKDLGTIAIPFKMNKFRDSLSQNSW